MEKHGQHSSGFALVQDSTSATKRCPKCRSVFVTDTECESCGLQLQFNRLQDPFGNKSYFSIKEQEVESSKVFGFNLPWRTNYNKKRFSSNYFYRLKALIEELCSSEDDFRDAEARRIYLLELGFLIEELTLRSDNEKETLEEILMVLQGPKTQTLSVLIQQKYEKALQEKHLHLSSGLLHKKFFGLIRLVSMVRIMAIMVFILFCGLALYRYLTLVA